VHPENASEGAVEHAAVDAIDTARKKRKHKEDKTKYMEINIEISGKRKWISPLGAQ
jgi:hypothetical protein